MIQLDDQFNFIELIAIDTMIIYTIRCTETTLKKINGKGNNLKRGNIFILNDH